MIPTILGGIGLFLLGMILMSDGLKAVAGDSLRRVLSRFVGGAFSALASGAAVTALVQSSSATTLTTIGFVSAGLITFPQAVGVIFGANVGTTSTGWIVSLLGLKVSISAIALPAVGAGALLKLLARDRLAALGIAIAGFGLVFVGIDTLQTGMQSLAQRVDPSRFPGDSLAGRFVLVIVGAVMTVVMQSSSAAVATTLAALHSGAIHLEQAAAMVIGQNVGTTVTAAIACIGASVAAKRTGVAHILFNGLTGLVAFAILPLFTRLVTSLTEDFTADGTVAIAAFHTAFNVLGVLLLLPWLRQFASWVERLVPERGPVLTRRLDPSVTTLAPVAVEAVRLTLVDTAARLAAMLREQLSGLSRSAPAETLDVAGHALSETRKFLGNIRTDQETAREHTRHLSALHALDHLTGLEKALRDVRPMQMAATSPALVETKDLLLGALGKAEPSLQAGGMDLPATELAETAELVREQRRKRRDEVLRATAAGQADPSSATAQLEALQWSDVVVRHLARALYHLAVTADRGGAPSEGQPAMDEVPAS